MILCGMAVQERIVELLRLPESGRGAPTLARVEETLTEGYAVALQLEAERLRLERRIRAAAGEAKAPGELETLSERLTTADGELAQLRTMLGTLHDRARVLRGVPVRG